MYIYIYIYITVLNWVTRIRGYFLHCPGIHLYPNLYICIYLILVFILIADVKTQQQPFGATDDNLVLQTSLSLVTAQYDRSEEDGFFLSPLDNVAGHVGEEQRVPPAGRILN